MGPKITKFKVLKQFQQLYCNRYMQDQSIYWLFILAIPVACISWTATHEEIFREPREYCAKRSKEEQKLFKRKFFYIFTCEYCFSHYVTLFMLLLTGYQLYLTDWRGYFIAGFSLVWIANIYMSLFNIIRIDLKKEKIAVKKEEQKLVEEPQ